MVKIKQNIGCIIQARLNSKRFPYKILKPIYKKYNALDYVINRLKMSKKINKIIIAYPKTKKNDLILKKFRKYKINFFQGSEKNVLDRYFKAAEKFNLQHIIRITSDCPFVDPKLIDKLIKKFFKLNLDYLCNTNPPTFPDGFDVEIFNFKSLKYCKNNAKLKYDLEHVTPFIRRSKKIIKGNYKLIKDYSKLRSTLDYPDDLNILRFVAKKLSPKTYFSWRMVTNKLLYLKKNAY